MPSGAVASVSQLASVIEGISGSDNFWYRGESKEWPVPCSTSFARSRDTACSYATDESGAAESFFTVEEDDIIRRFQATSPSDKYFEALNPTNDPLFPSWIAFAQHHGEPTRLLDVTRNPLVALYFAASEDPDEDGAIYVYTELWNPETPLKSRPNTYRDLFDVWFDSSGSIQNPPPTNTSLLHIPEHPSHRALAQNSGFVWKPEPLESHEPNTLAIRIDAGAKPDIIQRLHGFGIFHEALFPK